METLTQVFDLLKYLFDLFLHLDVHLNSVIEQYGTGTYAILIGIIFCETGLVVTPILPGDSLLFAAGAFAAAGSLDPWLLFLSLTVAAILGDALNYSIGKYFGQKLMEKYPGIFKREYLERTQKFYEKYGGKTVVFARFVPIVRTFAPFLAGAGRMSYSRFATYNVLGGVLWIAIFIWVGFYFGNIPAVKKNFTLVIIAIIIVSVLPAVVEMVKARRCSAT